MLHYLQSPLQTSPPTQRISSIGTVRVRVCRGIKRAEKGVKCQARTAQRQLIAAFPVHTHHSNVAFCDAERPVLDAAHQSFNTDATLVVHHGPTRGSDGARATPVLLRVFNLRSPATPQRETPTTFDWRLAVPHTVLRGEAGATTSGVGPWGDVSNVSAQGPQVPTASGI